MNMIPVRPAKVMGALCLLVLAACASPSADVPPRVPSMTPEPLSMAAGTEAVDETSSIRERMVASVAARMEIEDQRVIDAMKKVPRHLFVPDDYVDFAYNDTPLPIGYGQTISAPSIVVIMTDLLDLKKSERVLEIGTGSGYQAAMLAEVEDVEVYTIEIVPELAASAADRLRGLGYERIHARQADGYYGWPEFAPFDAIIVTAAPDHLPAPLAEQLKEGGRLVIPIGPLGSFQTLWKFVKQGDQLKAYNITGVSFVPFTGAGIQKEEGEEAQP